MLQAPALSMRRWWLHAQHTHTMHRASDSIGSEDSILVECLCRRGILGIFLECISASLGTDSAVGLMLLLVVVVTKGE
jgi:hypothetical protein